MLGLEEIKRDSDASVIASYAACVLTRQCAYRAFTKFGRSTTTSDLINEIHLSFTSIFDENY